MPPTHTHSTYIYIGRCPLADNSTSPLPPDLSLLGWDGIFRVSHFGLQFMHLSSKRFGIILLHVQHTPVRVHARSVRRPGRMVKHTSHELSARSSTHGGTYHPKLGRCIASWGRTRARPGTDRYWLKFEVGLLHCKWRTAVVPSIPLCFHCRYHDTVIHEEERLICSTFWLLPSLPPSSSATQLFNYSSIADHIMYLCKGPCMWISVAIYIII